LIPFKGDCTARVTLNVLAGTPHDVLDAVSFDHDGRTVRHALVTSPNAAAKIELELPLSADDYSVLGVTTPRMMCPAERNGSPDVRRLGIALGDVEIEPA
jgi:hypothetical protein